MSYDVELRFATPVPARVLAKTLLALHGFRGDPGGLSWTCRREADGCHFSVEAREVDREAGTVTALAWAVRWGGGRDEVLVLAGALTEVAEKHGGEVVLVSGDGASVVPADAFPRIVSDWERASVGVARALASLPATGLVPTDEATATRVRVRQLVDRLAGDADDEPAREDLEALGAPALLDVLEHETDEPRRQVLLDAIDGLGESVADLLARLVPLDSLVTRVGDERLSFEVEEALRRLGPPAVTALWEAYAKEPDGEGRRTLRAALESVSGQDVVVHAVARLPAETLVALACARNDDVAIEALARIGSPAVVAIFAAYDREPEPKRRPTFEYLLDWIGEAGRPAVTDVLRAGGSPRCVDLALSQTLRLEPTVELVDAFVTRVLAEPGIVGPDDLDLYVEHFAVLGEPAAALARLGGQP